MAGDLAENAVLGEERHDDELREEAVLEPLDQPIRALPRLGLAKLDRPHQPEPAHVAHNIELIDEWRRQLEEARSELRPAAIASSFGANVEPWLNAFSIESNTRSCTDFDISNAPTGT